LLCKPEIVRSRESDFQHLSSRREIDWRRLKPKLYRFFLGISGGGATWQFREKRGPSLCLGIIFDNQAQFHDLDDKADPRPVKANCS